MAPSLCDAGAFGKSLQVIVACVIVVASVIKEVDDLWCFYIIG